MKVRTRSVAGRPLRRSPVLIAAVAAPDFWVTCAVT
jgi:hypothetical protein